MARVNITVPDALIDAARAEGLNVSRVAANALYEELDRLRKVAELDAYLADLDRTLGPISAADQREAAEWANKVLSAAAPHASPQERLGA